MPLTEEELKRAISTDSSMQTSTTLTPEELKRAQQSVPVNTQPIEKASFFSPYSIPGISEGLVKKTGEALPNVLPFLGETISNVPSSTVRTAQNIVMPFLSPIETAKGIGSIGQGVVDVFQGEETPESKIAKNVANEMTRLLRDPLNTIKTDPIGVAVDLSAFLKPAQIAKLGLAGKASEFLNKIDPVQIAITTSSNVAQKVLKKVGDLGEYRAGIRTGLGGLRIAKAREAGQLGGVEKEAFLKGIKSKKPISEYAFEYERGVTLGKDIMAERFVEDTANLSLKDLNSPLNPSDVRKSIFQDLKKEGINPRIIVRNDGSRELNIFFDKNKSEIAYDPTKQEMIKKATEILKDWTIADIETSHAKIRQLDGLIERGVDKKNFENVNRILQGMREKIRDELGNKISGYNERAQKYATMKGFLEETEKALGLEPKRGNLDFIGIQGALQPISTKTLSRIGNSMAENISQSTSFNRAILEELDRIIETASLREKGLDITNLPESKAISEAIKKNIPTENRSIGEIKSDLNKTIAQENNLSSNLLTELTGAQLNVSVPQGSFRGALTTHGGSGIGALSGAGLAQFMGFGTTASFVGAAAGSGIGKLLSVLTVENPRVVGMFFHRLGATEKFAANLTRELQNLQNTIPKTAVLGTITIGQAVQRALDEENKSNTIKNGLKKLQAQ